MGLRTSPRKRTPHVSSTRAAPQCARGQGDGPGAQAGVSSMRAGIAVTNLQRMSYSKSEKKKKKKCRGNSAFTCFANRGTSSPCLPIRLSTDGGTGPAMLKPPRRRCGALRVYALNGSAVGEGSQACERSSTVAGQDQNANKDNSDAAQEERKHLPIVAIMRIGRATRMVLFVWGHGAISLAPVNRPTRPRRVRSPFLNKR